MRREWNNNRRSFTLVELLVVIVIIGILAALVTQAVMAAMIAAREATIKIEISNLSNALNSYKAEYGEFPPDFSDPVLVERHIRLRWPRINSTGTGNELTTIRDLNLSRAQALVFWLGGFSGSPTHPYTSSGQRTAMFDFDKTRLIDISNGSPVPAGLPAASMTVHPVYISTHGNKSGDGTLFRPYAYFDGRSYAHTNSQFQSKRPYLSDLALETYVAWDSYQILHPGLDGEWGQTGVNPPTTSYPSGLNYMPSDRDNITSFSRGRTLDDDVP